MKNQEITAGTRVEIIGTGEIHVVFFVLPPGPRMQGHPDPYREYALYVIHIRHDRAPFFKREQLRKAA